jgi:hypothetical protein
MNDHARHGLEPGEPAARRGRVEIHPERARDGDGVLAAGHPLARRGADIEITVIAVITITDKTPSWSPTGTQPRTTAG